VFTVNFNALKVASQFFHCDVSRDALMPSFLRMACCIFTLAVALLHLQNVTPGALGYALHEDKYSSRFASPFIAVFEQKAFCIASWLKGDVKHDREGIQ
jgi:hypothetical protein